MFGADSAQPVKNPLAAPCIQAEVQIGQAALPAGGILEKDVAIFGAVPLDGEAVVDLELVALALQSRLDRFQEI